MTRLTDSDFEALRKIDTPTICNLIEMVAPDRDYAFTCQHFQCVFPAMPPIVGYAKTATIRARVPVARSAADKTAFRATYLDYIGQGTEHKISVVQDLDEQPGYGSLWGEVFTNVHKALNVAGVVTNGSVRDLDMIAKGFQLLAGSFGPSRAHVHLSAFACEVRVHGMTVNDGDLVHADRHGAVVIPPDVARELPKALDLMARKEGVILDATRATGCTPDRLKAAFLAAAKIDG